MFRSRTGYTGRWSTREVRHIERGNFVVSSMRAVELGARVTKEPVTRGCTGSSASSSKTTFVLPEAVNSSSTLPDIPHQASVATPLCGLCGGPAY